MTEEFCQYSLEFSFALGVIHVSGNIMKSAFAMKNLREYIVYAMHISDWEVHEFDNAIVALNGSKLSFFNYVFPKTEELTYNVEEAKKICSYLRNREYEASWPLAKNMKDVMFSAGEIGLNYASTPKNMYLDLGYYRNLDGPRPELSLEQVTTYEELEIYDNMVSNIFRHDHGLLSILLRKLPQQDKDKSKLKVFCAKIGDKVLGSCIMFMNDGIAGLYGIGVLGNARNSGIGTQIVISSIRTAIAHDCSSAIAHCFPSSINIFSRLGFKNLGNFHIYTC